MISFFQEWLTPRVANEDISVFLSYILAVICILLLCLLSDIAVHKYLLKVLSVYIEKSKNRWDDILIEHKVFERLSHIAPFIVIHAFASVFKGYESLIQRVSFSIIIIIVLLSLSKILDTVNDIYRHFELSKVKPIKGYLQVVKIFFYVIGIISVISVLTERSPWILLSGIGAATAVLLLIFQNSLLGLVAGIQLAENDMLKIGDWIEMPKYGADGEVVDITLHTVKIQNWDNTITTVPTHLMISDSFKNWRGMQESGGRRIKRSVFIDMSSVKFCTEEMLEKFGRIKYISDYLSEKKAEIEKFNAISEAGSETMVNGRHLTNIGVFRIYIENYLKNHPKVHTEMSRIVRQLQPTEHGLPIEIYVFVNDVSWQSESVQSDIFDHILAVVPEFDLRVFQSPSGYDFRKAGAADEQN